VTGAVPAHAEGKAPGDRREPPSRTCSDTLIAGAKRTLTYFPCLYQSQ